MAEPIELFRYSGLMLIILDPNGKRYTNQVGGYCCNHPEVTGHGYLLLGTGDRAGGVEDALITHFTAEPYRGHCGKGTEDFNGITSNTVHFIDSILTGLAREESIPLIGRFRVDQGRLRDCQEAWIYLHDAPYPAQADSLQRHAILTWLNSD